jgi:transcriptional regulator with XRE-family HTH domain
MAMNISVKVGRRLQELRDKRGWNQDYLSQLSGVGRAHLSQIENGAVSPRIDTLYALCESMKIPLAEFFKGL